MKALPNSAIALFALLTVAGCECGPVTSASLGEAVFVGTDADGGELLTAAADLDFGPVVFGQPSPRTVRLRNVGRGPISLVSLERVLDAGVTESSGVFGGSADAGGRAGAFSASFDSSNSFGPTGELELTMTFRPPVPFDAAVKSVNHEGYRRLVFAGARADLDVVLHLTGRGVAPP
ncbi:MAG: hypothetical protein ACYC8T_22795 [Myxococcaceae bacterium]